MSWLDLLQQVSLLIAIWVAIYGIDSWRREHTGKRQIELAEDALALFYEAADAIRHIRHPASFGHELKDIERGETESDADYDARRNASIVFVRYNLYKDTFSKLHAMRYRFMAQIGKDKAKAFEDLREIVNSIQMSANMLARLWPRNSFPSDSAWESHRARVEKYEAIFWEGLEEDDPINPKLAAAIQEIESVCRAVISGKGTIYSFFNWRISRGS
ncbi:hypothetical protein BA022_11760 [Diaphorobacter nitroreducens]|uniref:hypothetical protein n=1 Tax=Diaphorobacter nitroreducens TaxID=164759 RepID=UPI000B59A60B|nr:hypothetical protein [Diaphorobacter nitroreducens]ASI69147.1 hypothetical protein BA022_11760 [Diaphorobacter nitroreducens]